MTIRHRSDRGPGRPGSAAIAIAMMTVVGLLTGCGTAPAAKPTPDIVDVLHVDSTTSLEVEIGQEIAFDLPGHAGTGYTWRATDPCPGFLQFIDGPIFQPDEGTRLGARGLFRFRYQVIGPGEASLRFDYLRAWEENTRPVRRSVVELTAK